MTLYRWRDHLGELDAYWITGQRAADVLGVNVARLNALAVKGFIPHETHADGTRLYRREQLEVVANAREARRGSCSRTSTAPTQSKCCMPTATL